MSRKVIAEKIDSESGGASVKRIIDRDRRAWTLSQLCQEVRSLPVRSTTYRWKKAASLGIQNENIYWRGLFGVTVAMVTVGEQSKNVACLF